MKKKVTDISDIYDLWRRMNSVIMLTSLKSSFCSVAITDSITAQVDANTGDELLGWDTDQFPMDIKRATACMMIVLKQGGLQPGGLNFDAKVCENHNQ